jgi:hypothetical protein
MKPCSAPETNQCTSVNQFASVPLLALCPTTTLTRLRRQQAGLAEACLSPLHIRSDSLNGCLTRWRRVSLCKACASPRHPRATRSRQRATGSASDVSHSIARLVNHFASLVRLGSDLLSGHRTGLGRFSRGKPLVFVRHPCAIRLRHHSEVFGSDAYADRFTGLARLGYVLLIGHRLRWCRFSLCETLALLRHPCAVRLRHRSEVFGSDTFADRFTGFVSLVSALSIGHRLWLCRFSLCETLAFLRHPPDICLRHPSEDFGPDTFADCFTGFVSLVSALSIGHRLW